MDELGEYVITADEEEGISLIDIHAQTFLKRHNTHVSYNTANGVARVGENTEYLASAQTDKPIILYFTINSFFANNTNNLTQKSNAQSNSTPTYRVALPTFMRSIVFSSDGKLLFGGGLNGLLYVWHTITGNLIFMQKISFSSIEIVKITRNGCFFFIATADGIIKAYNFHDLCSKNRKENLKEFCVWTGHLSQITQLTEISRSPFNAYFSVISASLDNTIKTWSYEANSCQGTISFPDKIYSVIASNMETELYACCGNGVIYEVPLMLFYKNRDKLNLAVSADANSLNLQTFNGHFGKVRCCTLNFDESKLISCGDDGFRVWNAKTRLTLSHLPSLVGVVSILSINHRTMNGYLPKFSPLKQALTNDAELESFPVYILKKKKKLHEYAAFNPPSFSADSYIGPNRFALFNVLYLTHKNLFTTAETNRLFKIETRRSKRLCRALERVCVKAVDMFKDYSNYSKKSDFKDALNLSSGSNSVKHMSLESASSENCSYVSLLDLNIPLNMNYVYNAKMMDSEDSSSSCNGVGGEPAELDEVVSGSGGGGDNRINGQDGSEKSWKNLREANQTQFLKETYNSEEEEDDDYRKKIKLNEHKEEEGDNDEIEVFEDNAEEEEELVKERNEVEDDGGHHYVASKKRNQNFKDHSEKEDFEEGDEISENEEGEDKNMSRNSAEYKIAQAFF